jgi:hypothetical protein
VARPEDAFERFPRLTRLAAVAEIVANVDPDSPMAALLKQAINEEEQEVDGLLARDMLIEGFYLARYGKALAWLEVPR